MTGSVEQHVVATSSNEKVVGGPQRRLFLVGEEPVVPDARDDGVVSTISAHVIHPPIAAQRVVSQHFGVPLHAAAGDNHRWEADSASMAADDAHKGCIRRRVRVDSSPTTTSLDG
jgi:hypothetical protein